MLFESGDVVKLKSDNRKMTVIEYQDDKVLCSWVSNEENQEDLFHEVQLVKWKKPKPFIPKIRVFSQ